MVYNPSIHKRKTTRIPRHDYSSKGYYFVTLLCKDRKPLFGAIEGTEVRLNEAGEIAYKCWTEIPEHFPHIRLEDFIIMPDHIHGVLYITETQSSGEYQVHAYQKVVPRSIGSVVRGYKIGVTKWFRNRGDASVIWHRNYHCVSLLWQDVGRVNEYIRNNPKRAGKVGGGIKG